MGMREILEFVDKLEKHWNKGELIDVSYLISTLYNKRDTAFLMDVMQEFKFRIGYSMKSN